MPERQKIREAAPSRKDEATSTTRDRYKSNRRKYSIMRREFLQGLQLIKKELSIMFEKSEAFDLFISERIDEKLKILSSTNGEYAAIKAKTAHEAESLETYFSHNDIKIIEDFYGLLCHLSAIENRYLYFQGFKDCIRMLKRLEVY